ncbi:MAG: hypothetical protein Q4F38_09930, partial [Akkermansia sp.]|nr:hypothetical protein [Akkermansia sp.]
LSFASSGSDFLVSIYPKVSLLRSFTLGYYTFAPQSGAFGFGAYGAGRACEKQAGACGEKRLCKPW